MDYVIVEISKAGAYGFTERGHAVHDGRMCLNQKEVMHSPRLEGTLAERAATLGGIVVDIHEAKRILSIYDPRKSVWY